MRFEYQGRTYEGHSDDGVNDVTGGSSIAAVNVSSSGWVCVHSSRGSENAINLNDGTFQDPQSGQTRQLAEISHELPQAPLGVAAGVWWRHKRGV